MFWEQPDVSVCVGLDLGGVAVEGVVVEWPCAGEGFGEFFVVFGDEVFDLFIGERASG